MRILITGSRNWLDNAPIHWALEPFRMRHPITIVHGGAKGADSFADMIARSWDMDVEVWRPDYKTGDPKLAPLRRNDAMLDSKIDVVFAFMLGTPERGGTLYTINGAKARGIPVVIYNWPGPPDFTG